MAGIGFELKKLFRRNSFLLSIRGYAYAAFVTVGPILLCIGVLTVLKELLEYMMVSYMERQLFLAAVMYAFIFSLMIVSGFAMMLSRYVSDKIYKEEYEDILPSLYGAICLCTFLGGIAGILFYWHSPLSLAFKYGSYIVYMELIILFLLMVYVSAIKDYKKIVYGFLYGTLTIIVCAYVFIAHLRMKEIEGVLYAMDIGFFVTIIFIMRGVQRFFNTKSKKYFDFLICFQEKPRLFLINFFYTTGIYIHNILFWQSDLGITVGDTFIAAPLYDISTFYAVLTILPATVIFVVKVETTFYDKYQQYFEAIVGGGGLHDIETAKKHMSEVLERELIFLMEIQLLISVAAIVIGVGILPVMGISGLGLEIFNFLTLGYYTTAMMFMIMTVLLYYDDQKGALWISFVFLVLNTVLTYVSILLGENYYGVGTIAAGAVSLLISILRLKYLLKNIDYRVFCSQPIITRPNNSRFARFVRRLGA